jgi:hypothetical protein
MKISTSFAQTSDDRRSFKNGVFSTAKGKSPVTKSAVNNRL